MYVQHETPAEHKKANTIPEIRLRRVQLIEAILLVVIASLIVILFFKLLPKP